MLRAVTSAQQQASVPANTRVRANVRVRVAVRVRVRVLVAVHVLVLVLVLGLVACDGKPAPAPATDQLQAAPPKNAPAPAPPEPQAPASALPQPDTQQPAPPLKPPEQTYSRPAIDFSTPESAMAVLTYAMQAKDVALLLDCFAEGAWQSVNTVEKPWQRTKLTTDNLTAGLKQGGDYRGFLFGDDGEDSFRNFFTGPDRAPWKPAGKLRFEPPDSSPDQPTYVQWKKQGPRYVVSEIAFPAD